MGKRGRHKRLFPRKFASDFINVGQGPNFQKMQAYDIYSKRSLKGKLPVLNNNFTHEVPATVSKQHYFEENGHMWLDTPRGEAQKKAKQAHEAEGKTLFKVVQSIRQQRVIEYPCVVLEKYTNFTLSMYFAGTEFVFVQQTLDKRWISCPYYGTREEALAVFHSETISWVICEDI